MACYRSGNPLRALSLQGLLALCLVSIVAAGQEVPLGEGHPPMDLQRYLEELDSWSAEVETTASQGASSAPSRLTPEVWKVNWRQQSFSVDTTWLRKGLEALRRETPKRESVRAGLAERLETLRREALSLQETEPGVPIEDARARLDDILARREFAAVHAPTWWHYAQERVREWLFKIMEKLFGGLGRMPNVSGVLVWMAIALLSIVLVLWIKRTWIDSAAHTRLALGRPLPRGRDWHDWARDALAAAGRGDYRLAVRCVYWAGVQRLAELGLWILDESRTPREYLRLLPPRDPRQPALASLTRRFEVTWYGYQPANAGDFQDVVQYVEKLGCLFPSTPVTEKS